MPYWTPYGKKFKWSQKSKCFENCRKWWKDAGTKGGGCYFLFYSAWERT
jgi:hypothetical protein